MLFDTVFWEQESSSNFRAIIKPKQFNGCRRFEVLIWEDFHGWYWAFSLVGKEILEDGRSPSLDIAMDESLEALYSFAEHYKGLQCLECKKCYDCPIQDDIIEIREKRAEVSTNETDAELELSALAGACREFEIEG